MKSINYFTFLTVAFFMMAGVISVFSVDAAAQDISDDADTVLELINDEGDLQDFLSERSSGERVDLVRELAAELDGDEAESVFSSLFRVLIFIEPNNAINSLTAALQASEGNEDVARGAFQGITSGTVDHPGLDSEEERLAALDRTSDAAASAAIRALQAMDMDPAGVASAAASGAMNGIEPGDEAETRAETVTRGMARGGIGAASDSNKSAVSSAMMEGADRAQDPDVRRGAQAGVEAGREGEEVPPVEVMPAGFDFTAPGLTDTPPDPDEVSPF